MRAERRLEKIRAILVNDGRGWDRSLEMLQEIEEIVTVRPSTIKFDIAESLIDSAAVDPKIEADVRAHFGKLLQAQIDNILKEARQ